MNPKDLSERLLELEEKEGFIESFNYRGTNSWLHIKFMIFQSRIKRNKKEQALSFEMKKSIVELLWINLKTIFAKKKEILFFGSSRGVIVLEGNGSDIYFPSGLNYKTLNVFYNLNKFTDFQDNREVFKKNRIFSENLIYPLFKLIERLSIWKYIFNFSTIPTITRNSSFNLSETEVISYHVSFLLRYYYFRALLLFFPQQRKAFIISAYSKSFITAALVKKGIPVTEIQHGHVGKLHIGYHYGRLLSSFPLPQNIIVKNDFWKKEVEESNFIQDVIVQNQLEHNLNLSEEYLALKPYFLFTGQGLYLDKIYSFITKAIRFCEKNNNWLIFKPHPSEDFNSKIRSLCSENPHVLKFHEGEDRIEALIKNCIAHISISSFCHFDAIHHLGRTFVLKIDEEKNIFDEYIEKAPENFMVIHDPNELSILF